MNDYLTSLAARALAHVPSIVPQQSSLYEPAAGRPLVKIGSGERRGAGLEHDEHVEVEPPHEIHRTRVPAATVRPVEQAQAIRHDESAVAPEVHVAQPQIMPQPSRAPANTRAAGMTAPATEAPLRPWLPATIAAGAQVSATAGRESREHAAAVTPSPDRPPQPPREKPRRDDSPADVDSASNQSSKPQPPQTAAPLRPLIAPTVTVAPSPLPQPAAASPSRRQGEPPVIRVTIGRVDVRAIASPPAPAAAPRAAGRAARLSLEDYLKQRSGGRR